jgi:uncharacterized protein (TIGR02001 family)
MMSRARTAFAALAAMVGVEARADSDHATPWSLSRSIALFTDYVDRGSSQSDGHGAVQGEMLWQHSSGHYLALWASSVDFDDGRQAAAEVNYIVGLERELGEVRLDGNVAYIHYPGAANELHYDLVEISTTVERTVRSIEIGAQAVFTPQNSGNTGKALYVSLGVARELTQSLSIGAHVGRQWHEREEIAGPSYHDWGLALEWTRKRFSAALRYSDTDGRGECGELCDAGVAAGISIFF